MEEGDVAVREHPRRGQQGREQAEEPARREHGWAGSRRTGGASGKNIYFWGQRTKKPSAQTMSWS